jgi:NAD(P)-dependent dehydrogenase (short-subunit alcohol dehydrogenase family)
MINFHNQRVLVIGGSSGIGFAAAQAFLAAGATVTIASRSATKLKDAAARMGQGVATQVLDTGDNAQVEQFLAQGQPWDHVVVSAAQAATGPARQLPLADAKAAMDSKFWGAYRVARVVRIRDGGSLTFVTGFLATRPNKASVTQGAVNAALEGLSRGLALEMAPVRVNAVSPGLIDTPLWNRLSADARKSMYDGAAARLPAARVGRAEDVANAILYVAGTAFATGSTIVIDGGGVIA